MTTRHFRSKKLRLPRKGTASLKTVLTNQQNTNSAVVRGLVYFTVGDEVRFVVLSALL